MMVNEIVRYLKQHKRELLRLLLIFLTILALFWLLKSFVLKIPSEKIKIFFQSWGFFGVFVYIFIVVTCTVISPLGSFYFWPIVLLVYGYPWAALYTSTGAVIGAVINFWIARKFGRPIIKKLISEKGMKLVDKISLKTGLRALFLLRLVPSGMFDYVSYAAGLVSLPFASYFLITAFFSLFYNLIIFYFMDKTLSLMGFPFYVLSGYFFIIVCLVIYILKNKMIKLKKKKGGEENV